ncbi:calpain-like_cysteine_peptidase_-_putative [Leishmania major strain Friedlin]|nr:calpain-like_cysteine_peptidase_-_putative [Leishmania major strain Friedlin]
MAASSIHEMPDSGEVFADHEFDKNNAGITDDWISIKQLYPSGVNQPLLPEVFSREQFGQGNHYECFMLSALAPLIRFPDVIRNCFVTKKVRQDGRYTFQFFRGQEWVKVEIDDRIAMEEGEVLYVRSPTEHWWPLLLEKAYAKFYTAYDHLEGCTLQETFHDLTGNPVLNIPMDAKLAKAANCNVLEGRYWLDLAQRIQSGEFVASALTKDVEVETMGLQREQQYGVLEIFSLHGTSALDDIVIHLHNPFEDDEFLYSGPLNPNDSAWSEKQRVKYDVINPRSIFLPLNVFLRIVNSMQLCYISTVASDATYFEDEWKGESAGGNPTYVTWRKNPLYCISNHGTEAVTLSFVVKQEDQRHRKGPEETITYKQCGMILSQYSYLYPIPTFWVTGNNHKPIYKGLLLNSREVASSVIVPPQSLCYLVPSCIHQGEEAKFLLSAHRMVHEDYSNITMKKLTVPEMDWESPAVGTVQLQMRTKDRLDFYVDEPTDVHILLHQTKPYVSPKTGGDAMAQDYMGMYLYDDTDRKIAGVHAATNFRETSIIHRLPRSGRYAISITCPRGKGHIPANVTIVSSFGSHIRRVNAPEDAAMLPDEAENVADSEGVDTRVARIDYNPFQEPPVDVREHPDSNVPFEDRGFMLSNRDVTSEPWVHIGDLYPEGKTRPLLPNELSRDQFGQGAMYECCCLTGFATLLEHHPDVIRNCFISKNPRKDGRYTFQFHRYGQWIKVEIDDRIPMVKGDTVFCRSPTHHWWPLLLEKAYAKFYTLYENLAGCSLAEVYHDFSGCPVINTPLDEPTAKSAGFDITSPVYWVGLRDELRTTAVAAQCGDNAESLGLAPHQFYGILDILATSYPPRTLSEVIVQLHNPYAEIFYTGPMSDPADPRWASREMRHCNATQNTIFVPVDVLLRSFFTISQAHLRGLMEPCWNFHSEWGDGTNGGNPSLLTWRENPLYIVRNTGSETVEMMGMIRQPDKRHQLHLLPELSYVRCDLLLAQSMETDSIPTYLVTHNNHDVVHKRIFLNYREVASKIRVPPKSQCYLVPTAMYHEKSIFLLSYWYRTPADEGAVSMERLRVNVARDLPAVKHVTLVPEGKDRVDFFVDVPTDAHILLSQWNRDARGGSDVRTDNYVGMYLYDDANQQMAQVSAASNLKEIGLVAHLPAQGHYVLSITCPASRDEEVKCRVEIVCVEMARVRITDVYENPSSFEELEEEPPVALVDSDTARSDARDDTQSVEATAKTRPPENTEAKEREKTPSLSFMRPRYQGICTADLPLMETPAFAKMAGEREQLKRHALQNAAHMNSLQNKMEDMATRIADDMHDQERVFLGPEVEGVPLELLPLNEDEEFTGLEHELRVAMRDPQKNCDDVVALRETLKERAGEMAKKMKENERELFLNPMPLGISCDGLPLDTDPEFHALEVARLRERQEESCDEAKIHKLNDALNERAEDLARAKLAADRQYLNPEHLRVAVDELPLNEDRNFILKEALRQEKLQNSRESAAAIAALENELNNMAKAMAAEMLAKQRPSYLAPEHHGRRIEDLPLNDSDDFLKKERRRRDLLKQPSWDIDVVAEIDKELSEMADAMARAMNAAERPQYMKASYYDKTLSELSLDTDSIIARLEAQRARLKRNPVRNAEAIHATEAAIISRAEALAKAMINEERARLYGKPSGVPVNLLDLDDDQVIQRLEEERMELLKMPKTDPRAIASNEEKLKARAAKIAEDFRDNMRVQITGEGHRSPSVMSIGSDAPCQDLEEKLYALLSEDPIANEDQISDIKDAIRKRNAELKRQAVQELRAFLDDKPFGILLADVGLDHDPEYMDREKKLKKGLADNLLAAQITSLQEGMQHRVNELAAEELTKRYPFIHTHPAGIPLAALPSVGRDQPFWEAIDNFDKAKTHNTCPSQLSAYEKPVNERLVEIAEAVKWKERDSFLHSRPGGVPLKALPLDNDHDFIALETRRRTSLQSGIDPQAEDIQTLESALRTRAHDLACEKKWADRDRVLDPKPEGVPLRCVPLDEDPEFVALEDEWRGLLQDPQRNSMPLKDLERRMNDRAHDLACGRKWADRDRVLDPKPEGVPLRCVPLDEDPEFVALEDEWRGLLQDPQRNSMPLKDLERRMNDRAHDLACGRKWADRDRVLDPKPEGVPLRCVPLDEDPEFVALEDEWRGLLQDPQRNSMPLKDLERRMNDRAHDLACGRKWADRDRVLDPKPEGVPLRCVPLDEDPEFVALEDEWRGLQQDAQRNSMPLKDLERRMNDRAHDLACGRKWADRDRVLDPKPEGVPLRCVPLDEDPEFVALEDEWRGLLQDAQRNSMPLKDLERRMNDRAHDLACEKKWADRDRVLDPKPEGVPLRCVPLDEDPEFVALEDEWRGLLQDAQRNSMPLKDLERRMNDRAHDLACEKKWADRDRVLDPKPEGVPLRCVPLDEDPEFVALEDEWRGLQQDAQRNSMPLKDLERRMNDRAHDLACEKKWADRDRVLDPKPEGVPLRCVPLDEDPEFVALADEWRGLLQDAQRNSMPLKDLERRMNDRAHDLACEKKWADRDRVLDPKPEGVPLRCVPLDEDPEFVALEDEWRGLQQDAQRNSMPLKDLERRMNDRAHDLACEKKWADRDRVLDPKPEGVPLRCVPLDEDPEFVALEDEWRGLLQDAQRNSMPLKDLERRMNDRAHDLACGRKWADRDRVLDPKPEGVPLRCVPLDEDPEFVALEDEWRGLLQDPQRNSMPLKDLERRMNDRAHDLACGKKWADRDRVLDPKPEGVPLRCVPLDEDPEFVALEDEWRGLQQDAQRNSMPLKDLERRMNDRAHDLACGRKWADRDRVLDPKPEGVPLRCVPLDEDPEFVALEDEWRGLQQDAQRNSMPLKDLERRMNDRAHDLACGRKWADRDRVLDPKPEGVPLRCVPLDEDPEFVALEDEWRGLQQDAQRNSMPLKDLERRMNDRAHDLACGRKWADRDRVLDPKPEGVPLRCVPLDEDPEFVALEDEWRGLLQDAQRNSMPLKDLERRMNDRAHDLACGRKWADRDRVLDPKPEGVPLRCVPLDEDPEFVALEDEWRGLLQDPQRNSMPLKDLERRMNDRAHDLACGKKWADRDRVLDPKPEGVPLRCVPLDEDPEFVALEDEWRGLLQDAQRNSMPLKDLERRMNDRAHDLACEKKWADRDRVLDPKPEGVPLRCVPLDEDPEFVALEDEWRGLLQDAQRNSMPLKDLERRMNDRAHDLACEKKWADRDRVLDPKPEGVPLRCVPLDEDPEFVALEDEWRGLQQDAQRNSMPLKDLERRMNDRAHDLACEKKWADRDRVLDPKPEGVPLRCVPLDEDPEFVALEDEWRGLLQDAQRNSMPLKDLERRMNDRAHDLACGRKWADRDRVLDPKPEGVPLRCVPLDEDPEFVALEDEWRGLLQDPQRNSMPLKDLERRMNDRAHDLACGKKWADRDRVLDPKPEGVPLRCVPLDEDPEFVALEDEWRGLQQDAQRNSMPLKDLERRMNDRAHDLACGRKWADRDRVLDPKPEGVPLRCVPLDEDPEFVALEDEWRGLQQDAQRNSMPLKDLERRMNDRAHDLACEKKWADRDRVLDPKPEGVPLRCVPLDEDPEFVALEDEWRGLLQDAQRNSMPLKDLERRMNDRAHDLACEKKWADRDRVLDPKPEGVPLRCVPLDEDPEFVALEDEWRGLQQDAQRNSMPLKDLERRMNDRAHDLACEKKWADRDRVLDPKPEGVPLRCVPLDEDPEFVALEDEWRGLLQDPQRNSMPLKDLERRMNDRAHDLACEKKWADRDRVLDPKPEGVPLRCVPLDEDPEFVALEDEWRGLLQDPQRNSMPLKDLERRMNDRAHDLACEKKWADRDRVLDPKPEGVPLRCVPLDEDPEFVALEDERRGLLQDPQRNSMPLKDLERRMNDRAHDLACEKKWADRDRVLDPKPEGVPLRCVPLDEDPEFVALEDEWRGLLQDPQRNSMPLKDLERRMNDRAHDLACEKKWADRDRVLDPKPEGVPLRCVPLDEDPEFVALEDEWRGLQQDAQRNSMPLKDLERRMNDRAHDLACGRKWADRDRVLDPKPEGVPLRCVPLDEDPEFVALEDEWRGLQQDAQRNSMPLKDLERRMNDRAHDLACEKKWADRDRVLDPKPEGVPLRCVPLDEDPEFVALEDERRGLLQDPQRNSMPLKDLERRMNDRAHDLACGKKWADRDRVLDPKPEGVPLRCVPLDEDPEFVALEDEWRGLLQDPQRNAKRIAGVEEDMSARALWVAQAINQWKEEGDREEYEEYVKRGASDFRDVDDRNTDDLTLATSVVNGTLSMKEGFKELLGTEVDGVPILLLNLDEDSVFSERNRVYMESGRLGLDRSRLSRLEEEMLDRAHALARRFKDAVRKVIVGEQMSQMAEGGAELDSDEMFLALERELHNLEACDPHGKSGRRAALEESMRQRASELAKPLPHIDNRGIPVDMLNERSNGDLCHKRPSGGQQRRSSTDTGHGELGMDKRGCHIADEAVADDALLFFGREVYGIPVDRIPLREDEVFRGLAEERRRVTSHPEDYSAAYKEEVEDAMRRRVEELADEYKRDHAERTAARDERPKMPAKPNGVPKESGSAARRPRAKKKLKEVEERTEEHRLETVEEASPFTDPSFHSANKQVADTWPRIADVYPEGLTQPLLPDYPKASDMASSAGDLTYLAPFLAALSRHPPLLHRLFQTKMHPVRAPYRFVFFDPNSVPVTVEIDDRIPCDVNGVPRFTVSPSGAWWPLLVERAYAKYVGGYERFDQCTSHETLRDLTGRPVTHLPLDAKLSAEVVGCNYRDVAFWRRIHEQLERGDVFVAVSGDLVPDGIHPHCYYAVFDVIETVPGSNDPSDVVVKIHNCYHDAPQYRGPLAMGDSDWTPILRSVCKADPESEPEFLYLPQPVFLRNFSSMQRCHINCGDRLTVSGEWADDCSGGSPTYTTFRQNPMYLLQNNSNCSVTVLAELRHSAPVYYDAHSMGVYHLTALALLRPDRNAQLVAPLLAHNTHKFVQKGLLTDAREVCAEMELPANSTCYLIPYTKKKACFGKYQLSVYPQDNPVNLTTLRPITETHNCMTKDVVVQPGSGTSARVDIMVSEPCDVHALLHQNKVTDPTAMRRGDYLAEDEIFMAAYEKNALLVCSTGDASNAREHSVAFRAARAGRYTFLIGCPSRPVSGDAPCTLIIYTPKFAQANFASVNESTRSRVPPRVQPVNAATTSASARLGLRQFQAPQSSAPVSNGAVHTPRGNPRSREYSQ